MRPLVLLATAALAALAFTTASTAAPRTKTLIGTDGPRLHDHDEQEDREGGQVRDHHP